MNDSRTTEQQPDGKPYVAWGAFNWGIPRGVYRTRREALQHVAAHTGEPWSVAKHYYTVKKVKVTPL